MSFTAEQVIELVDLWFEMDENDDGKLNRKEMRQKMKREGYSDKEIADFAKKLGLEAFGYITFEDYCVALGVEKKEQKRREFKLKDEVQIVSSDMSGCMQHKIADMTEQLFAKNSEMKDIPKALKAKLDDRFEKLWHVVIVKGQYWAYYSYEPKHSFVFRLQGYIVLVWRTPFM